MCTRLSEYFAALNPFVSLPSGLALRLAPCQSLFLNSRAPPVCGRIRIRRAPLAPFIPVALLRQGTYTLASRLSLPALAIPALLLASLHQTPVKRGVHVAPASLLLRHHPEHQRLAYL